MSNTWFISDTHFGHEAIMGFADADGIPTGRPQFSSVDEMDEVMIERWNATVAPEDKVYHLGDVTFSLRVLKAVMPRLNGRKRLLLGNHDTFDVRRYREYFQKVYSWRHFVDEEKGVALVCTHFPLHPSSLLGRFHGACLNVHGHIHNRVLEDPLYCNVCVEQIDYTPVSYDWLIEKAVQLKQRGEERS